MDDAGRVVEKPRATRVAITEYDDAGNELQETFAVVDAGEPQLPRRTDRAPFSDDRFIDDGGVTLIPVIPDGLTAPAEIAYLTARGVAPPVAAAIALDRHPEYELPDGANLSRRRTPVLLARISLVH